ncbi:protein krueppel-like, partial [Halyomorpha halys]|uniref:protein krueppel-like n=1 Tax=Halyomorpha halys TaxID=286706 RepID=UPI0006D4CB1B
MMNETGLSVPSTSGYVQGQQEGELPVPDDDLDHSQNEIHQINIPVIHHHAQEKAYQCQHCDYKGSIPFGFKKHMMPCNSVEKHQQCPHCEHRIVELSNLKQHVMTRHTDEKPHQCPHCEYKAVQVSNLKQHIM